uniref:Uncharacterized protein n=1 Tax=Anguilla anguilla TaxID=7936 RepID=A0A0E9S7Q4_ANGAN
MIVQALYLKQGAVVPTRVCCWCCLLPYSSSMSKVSCSSL